VPWTEVPALLAGAHLGYAGHRPTSADLMYHSPLKLYEYLAMGLPVLAAHAPDADRVLGDGLGFLFAAGDVDGCATALRRGLDAIAVDASLSGRARARAVTESWESRARQVLSAVAAVRTAG
jgi:glycosyltransferase involved in cell wall biosynthesis